MSETAHDDAESEDLRVNTDLSFEELVKRVVYAEPEDTDASDED